MSEVAAATIIRREMFSTGRSGEEVLAEVALADMVAAGVAAAAVAASAEVAVVSAVEAHPEVGNKHGKRSDLFYN
jgi:hypothetical protein